MDPAFLGRYVKRRFLGVVEKKRLEMLQLAILAPKYAVLDETDSGLDIDALQSGRQQRERAAPERRRPSIGFLVDHALSAHPRNTSGDVVHIMIDGRIVKTGGPRARR